jgi:two-component system, OmpR family, sensor kinase
LYEPANNTLVAMGVSHTPLGKKQKDLGLDRLPLANGGRTVQNYQQQQSYITGHSDQDPEQLVGLIDDLGIRSVVSAPLYVKGELRGVLEATALQVEAFNEYDLRFLEAVAGWVGTILHRAELNEQLRSAAVEEARRTTAEELVTVIAHDLRNYLTPLLGRVSFIHKRALQEKRERDLDDSERMAVTLRGMQRMINDLLDVGRLEQGLFSITKQSIDLVRLVQEIVDTLDTSKCPVIVQSYQEVRLEVDPQRIRQALENLLTNALKYSPEGVSVNLTVDTEQGADGQWARVAVIDKGPGISTELLPQLFRRFKKDTASTGLGLGLYIAQGIAHAHGGTLTVESNPNTGTSFHLALPISQ